MRRFFTASVFVAAFLGMLAAPVFADTATPTTPGAVRLANPLGASSVPALAGLVIRGILGLIGSVALLAFIWGGFLWLTAAGNPEKIKQGRDTMLWTAAGLVLIFSSYILARFVITALHGS